MIDRLLIRAPNWMGDVVLSLGAVRDLRRNFPAARIEVLARPGVADLYRAVAEVDAVGVTGAFRDDVRTMAAGAHDAVALLTNSFGSALQAFGSKTGDSSCESDSGGTRSNASFGGTSFSSTRSVAITTAA